jgi:hypothetical protein
MNTNNQKKLQDLLKKRLHKLENLNNFYDYFEKFAFIKLRNVVKRIDNDLNRTTSESLKIFSDNPYLNTNSRYFVMVQLLINSNRNHDFFLDNTEKFPLIKFEGDEFSGNVTATILFGDRINKTKSYPISYLTSEENIYEIILNFLETIYNL